jgi:hypothetical protein
MTRDYMAIERAREAGLQPDYKDTKDCGCRECFLENEVERLTTERDAAYQRGAKAMREAVAGHFEERARQQRLAGDYIMAPVHEASATRIRALPIPEDK